MMEGWEPGWGVRPGAKIGCGDEKERKKWKWGSGYINNKVTIWKRMPTDKRDQQKTSRTGGGHQVRLLKVYIVCAQRKGGVPAACDAERFFKPKFSKNTDYEYQREHDFDPCYALRGGRARNVLDWERLAIEQAAHDFRVGCGGEPAGRVRLKVCFVDAGGEEQPKPVWYGEKSLSEEEQALVGHDEAV